MMHPTPQDPALSARTFSNNPTLTRALGRIAQRAPVRPLSNSEFRKLIRAQRAARIERAFRRDLAKFAPNTEAAQ